VNIDKSGIISADVLPEDLIPLPNILTKTCRGKVMKEKLKSVKTKNYFLLPNSSFRHCLSFAMRKISVDRAKHHVSSPQTYPLARRNDTFGTAKRYLWQIRFL
jgi:hypothetical protein